MNMSATEGPLNDRLADLHREAEERTSSTARALLAMISAAVDEGAGPKARAERARLAGEGLTNADLQVFDETERPLRLSLQALEAEIIELAAQPVTGDVLRAVSVADALLGYEEKVTSVIDRLTVAGEASAQEIRARYRSQAQTLLDQAWGYAPANPGLIPRIRELDALSHHARYTHEFNELMRCLNDLIDEENTFDEDA